MIRHCNRPFETVDEMDAALIANWNRQVRPKDTIYIIGDLMFLNRRPANDYLEELNGNKVLILGNHDHTWIKRIDRDKTFVAVTNMLTIQDGTRAVVLCHYPMMAWCGSGRGSLMVHGHIHNNTNSDYWPYLQSHPNILNAGVDVNGFIPVTLDELIANNARFKESVAGQKEDA